MTIKNSYPFVAVVIINWNGQALLKNCLPSIKRLSYPREKIKIVIVDNGSSDDSVLWIKKNYPEIRLLQNTKNVGFAAANNTGICEALKNRKIKYIVTLNNDTEADKNWLGILVRFMEQNKNAGVAVGKILQLANKRRIDSAGDFFAKNTYRVINRGFNEIDHHQYDSITQTLSACAAASIFRANVLKQIRTGSEYFDEDFKSYIEDVDLNLRLRLNGWYCYYVPTAVVYHIGSATSSKVSREYKEFLSRRNRILMSIKVFPLPYMFFLLWKYILPSKVGINHYVERKMKIIAKKGIQFYAKKGAKHYFSVFLRRYVKGIDKLSILEVTLIQLKALIAAFFLMTKMIEKRKIIQKKRKLSNKDIHEWFTNFAVSH